MNMANDIEEATFPTMRQRIQFSMAYRKGFMEGCRFFAANMHDLIRGALDQEIDSLIEEMIKESIRQARLDDEEKVR